MLLLIFFNLRLQSSLLVLLLWLDKKNKFSNKFNSLQLLILLLLLLQLLAEVVVVVVVVVVVDF